MKTSENLLSFIDRHDVSPCDGAADQIDATHVDDLFLSDFQQTFLLTYVEGDFWDYEMERWEVHEVGRELSNYMDLTGVQAFFQGFFSHCPPDFESALCSPEDSFHASIPVTPILDTPYADRTLLAIDNIFEVDPDLGLELHYLAMDDRLLLTSETYAAPATIDPRNDTIILTEEVFSSKPSFEHYDSRTEFAPASRQFDTSLDTMFGQEDLFSATLHDFLKKEALRNKLEELLRAEKGVQMQNSSTGIEVYERLNARGYNVNLFPEETLAHEYIHLTQIDGTHPSNGYLDSSLRPSGYYYDLLVYVTFHSVALRVHGLNFDDVLDGVNYVDYGDAGQEGLISSVDISYRQTEAKAKEAAGNIIASIAERIESSR